jgi:mannose-6-phosphate isomerase-like protein (cupin superfamily)
MSIEVVNLADKLASFSEQFAPRIVAEVNDCSVKLVKLQGPFMWHHHEAEDELFLVVRGELRMAVREAGSERQLTIRPGEFVMIPHGVEHMPSAEHETEVLLIEPKSTLNTGNVHNERTRENLERI